MQKIEQLLIRAMYVYAVFVICTTLIVCYIGSPIMSGTAILLCAGLLYTIFSGVMWYAEHVLPK